MTITGSIIIICWVILGIFWTVGAFFQKRTSGHTNHLERFMQIFYILIPIILLIKYDFFNFLEAVILKTTLFVNFLSITICIIGLLVCILARIELGGNWSAKVVIKKEHELISTGPYRFVRHPIYTGLLLLYLGSALAVGRVAGLIGFLILFFGLYIKLRLEEKLMIKYFKEKYIVYMKKTNALIPFVL
jgi:protein-S-isoprenylcysteine O-methyltransferase Ste14